MTIRCHNGVSLYNRLALPNRKLLLPGLTTLRISDPEVEGSSEPGIPRPHLAKVWSKFTPLAPTLVCIIKGSTNIVASWHVFIVHATYNPSVVITTLYFYNIQATEVEPSEWLKM